MFCLCRRRSKITGDGLAVRIECLVEYSLNHGTKWVSHCKQRLRSAVLSPDLFGRLWASISSRFRTVRSMSSSKLKRAMTPRAGTGTPVDAILVEARLNFAVKQFGSNERFDRLTCSQRRRRVGVQPTSSAVSGRCFYVGVARCVCVPFASHASIRFSFSPGSSVSISARICSKTRFPFP